MKNISVSFIVRCAALFTVLFLSSAKNFGQIITTFAGSGSWGITGSSGDGGAATAALLYSPSGLAVDLSGNLYFADYGNNRIRKVAE